MDILLTGLRYPELRNKLKARREQLGLTQTELARRMNTQAAAISHWERGIAGKPTLDTLMRWCKALHMELGFFIQPREEVYDTPLDWDDEH